MEKFKDSNQMQKVQYTLCPKKSEPPKHFAITAANLRRFK